MTTVAVALSGGVDSSVVAYLLQKEGYDVIGITGVMVDDINSENIIKNAKSVADYLNIKHYIVDTTKTFNEKVIQYFDDSYKNGFTPNPCIMCNKYIKWGSIYNAAVYIYKADYIATGHYANVKFVDNYYKLYPAKDVDKDQLYFLFQLNQEQLSKTLFPLCNLTKNDIRKIAIENNLPTKSSKESQDICFIQKPMTTKKYLIDKLKLSKGDFVDIRTGKILGHHNGCFQYTVGQRKGIGIAATEPLYVINIDAKKNIVYVGTKNDTYSSQIILDNFMESYPLKEKEFEALVKIRYNMKPIRASICIEDLITIKFNQPVGSVAKGQAYVLYDINDGHLIGGGFIS